MTAEPARDVYARAEAMLGSDPVGAVDLLGTVGSDSGGPDERARAAWIVGRSQQMQGQFEEAEESLSTALVLAEDSVLADEIAISRAAVLFSLGNSDLAEALIENVVATTRDERVLSRGQMQLAMLHHRAGRFDESRKLYIDAARNADLSGDRLGLMRASNNHGLLELYCGNIDRAEELFVATAEVAETDGHTIALGVAFQNRGLVAYRRGDGRSAIELYEHARRLLVESNGTGYLGGLQVDIARNLSDLSLVVEARQAADDAVVALRATGSVADEAEALLYAGHARLADDDPAAARESAVAAEALFRRQDRVGWVVLARHMCDIADAALGGSDRLLDRVSDSVAELESAGWAAEAARARVLAARLALELGRLDDAERMLQTVTGSASDRPAVERAAAAAAAALLAVAQHRFADARSLVGRGLDELESLQHSFGTLELRTHAVAHRSELIAVGLDLAAAHGAPEELLAVMEASHRIDFGTPRLGREMQAEVTRLLTELRTVRAAAQEATGEGAAAFEIEAHRIEGELQAVFRRLRADGRVRTGSVDAAIVDLRNRVAIEFHRGPTGLLAVHIGDERCMRLQVDLGARELESLLTSAQFALHRLSRASLSAASTRASVDVLAEAGNELQEQLLPTSWATSDTSVVIVPSGLLSGTPWSVLPWLGGRATVVAPSLSSWSVADRSSRSLDGGTVAVAGPGLDFADAEVNAVATQYASVQELAGPDANAARVLDELRSASIAHFACHGTFRADNPMFSSLRLADGDLTIYDLEQCERLPHTIVMSACNAGQNAVLRGGALLGMTSALIQLGVSSVIAPLTPVNDERSVDLMVRLHTHLAAGVPAAEALAKASIGPDGELDPTAAPFICFGS